MIQKYQVLLQQGEYLQVEERFPGQPGDPVWVLGIKETDDQPKKVMVEGIVLEAKRVWAPKLKRAKTFTPLDVVLRDLSRKQLPFGIVVPANFFVGTTPSLLEVEAANLGSKPGQLWWVLLHYQNTLETQVAFGDDRLKPNKAYGQFPGAFRPGIYILHATLFGDDGREWLQDFRVWEVCQACLELRSGRSLDKRLPLFYDHL